MLKQCARCVKTVYPTEELKCMDKVWHKMCFKCNTCGMTLNMKNYKGYEKLPYCNAHYPKSKHTVVADTPENRRIAENTKIQSNIAYHKEYEQQKGKKTSVADDPETQRVRQNMEIISNVSYHGDKDKRQWMEQNRPAEQVEGQRRSQADSADAYPGFDDAEAGRARRDPRPIADYDPMLEQQNQGTPYSNRNSAGARQVYDSNVGRDEDEPEAEFSSRDAMRRISQGSVKNRVQRFSSSGDDEQSARSPGYSRSSQRSSGGYDYNPPMEAASSRKVGSISDYDPLNDKYGSITGQHDSSQRKAQMPMQQPYQPPPPQPQPPAQKEDAFPGKGMVCKAMYDYDAADTDEVSFKENDLIIFCQPIDAGWMEGTVERSGKRGMLPSNYVEHLKGN